MCAVPAMLAPPSVNGSTPSLMPQARGPDPTPGHAPAYPSARRDRAVTRRASALRTPRELGWSRVVKWFWQRDAAPRRTLALRSRDEIGRRDPRRLRRARARDRHASSVRPPTCSSGTSRRSRELIASTPELAEKESLSRAAGAALTKHEELVALIRERGDDPTQPDAAVPRAARRVPPRDARRRGRRRRCSRVHITAGMLDDFYLALAVELRRHRAPRRRASCARTTTARRSSRSSAQTIASDQEWRSLLAMWGRRLVGDTLLIARAALRPTSSAHRRRSRRSSRSSPS